MPIVCLFLRSTASSDGIEPYMFLKERDEKSLNPAGSRQTLKGWPTSIGTNATMDGVGMPQATYEKSFSIMKKLSSCWIQKELSSPYPYQSLVLISSDKLWSCASKENTYCNPMYHHRYLPRAGLSSGSGVGRRGGFRVIFTNYLHSHEHSASDILHICSYLRFAPI